MSKRTGFWISILMVLLGFVLFANCGQNETVSLTKTNQQKVDSMKKWPGGVVSYYISGEFDTTEESRLADAMSRWQSKTGSVSFVDYTGKSALEIPEPCLDIQRSTDRNSASTVGAVDDPVLQLSNVLFSKRTVIHELGHVIGLLHEHQRPDRDDSITIQWENIYSQYYHNFEKLDSPLLVEEDFPYDISSVMHYSASSGAKDWFSKSITINDGSGLSWGFACYISAEDISKVQNIYE
ncbi:MAG: hypothetical protein GY754_01370 [bacterium]|nr:hypothetical protein [bacterium]